MKSVRLGGPPIAVVSGYGSIWALDSGATLYRLNPSTGRIVKRVVLPVTAAYNIWIGGGSVWVADDQGGLVVRVAPATSKVVAQPLVGDGPADMAFDGASAWVINHRDRVLSRIDLRTNRSQQVAVLPGENQAPERMVWLKGKLWITGRGADLLRVNPASGAVEKTIEIGASGIDVATDGRNLWVPTRTATVDRSGFPTMTALKRVSGATGAVTTVVRARGRVDVHGLATRNGFVWLADNTNGRLYRLR